MKRNRPIPFLLALAASLFLAGCWGSTKEESRSVPTTPPTLQGDNLSAVAQMCATCHSVLPSHAPLAIRANLDTACTDCHRDPLPHVGGRVEVNRQWAASGHADFTAKPWSEDDFKSDAESSCHRCHTATGYERFTDNQLAYHQSNYIVADNLAFIANSVTGSKMEVLYCRACHVIDPASGLALAAPRRQVQNAYLPRGKNKNYTPDNVAKAGLANLFTLTRAEIGDSVLCSNCHAGRKAGAHVHNILGDNTATYDNVTYSSFNVHYLSAAQSLYQDNTFDPAYDNAHGRYVGPGGYQFPDQPPSDYTPPFYYDHKNIGTTASLDFPAVDNSRGPCVTCHMSSTFVPGDYETGSHSLLPVRVADNGDILEITSPVCANCHKDPFPPLTPSLLTEKKREVLDNIAILEGTLASYGIYYDFLAGRPYYYNDPVSRTSSAQFKLWATKAAAITLARVAVDNGTTTAEDLVGACYNLHFLSTERGSWVHNDIYSKRLIFDSLRKLGATPAWARP